MQSYLKYKAYYDRKAKASPLETTDYCYILNPKADTQATKIPFREFRWKGPYKVEQAGNGPSRRHIYGSKKRKPLFLQLETTKALKKLKIEKKKFRVFYRNFV